MRIDHAWNHTEAVCRCAGFIGCVVGADRANEPDGRQASRSGRGRCRLLTLCPRPEPKPTMHPYVVGNDDELAVERLEKPDLTKSIPVRSDGKISLPLVREFRLRERRPYSLSSILPIACATITVPEVTVIVEQIDGKKYNIMGMVGKPGILSSDASTTIMDAIAVAGRIQGFCEIKGCVHPSQSPRWLAGPVELQLQVPVRPEMPREGSPTPAVDRLWMPRRKISIFAVPGTLKSAMVKALPRERIGPNAAQGHQGKIRSRRTTNPKIGWLRSRFGYPRYNVARGLLPLPLQTSEDGPRRLETSMGRLSLQLTVALITSLLAPYLQTLSSMRKAKEDRREQTDDSDAADDSRLVRSPMELNSEKDQEYRSTGAGAGDVLASADRNLSACPSS